MTLALYVLGAPGVGKTTLMDNLLTDYEVGPYVRLGGGFGYEPLLDDTDGPAQVGVHLGRTRERFGGTDALAMNALPAAVAWANDAELPPLIFGEGARLAHLRFLKALAKRTDLLVVLLTANPDLVDQRCASRGSTQDETWRKGATTRASNAFLQVAAAGINHVCINTNRLSTAGVEDIVRSELAGVTA